MGKHAGATIEVATKSGTRDFYGEAFEYLRNDHLDANDFCEPAAMGRPKPAAGLQW
jgi:hypothetical protein